jgi:hypothetical protein
VKRAAFLFSFWLAALPAFAGSVTLAWDASPSPGVVGYNVYYGTASGQYDFVVEGIGSDLGVTIPELRLGGIYFFVATAFDAFGIESDYSTECRAKIINPTDYPKNRRAIAAPAILEQ